MNENTNKLRQPDLVYHINYAIKYAIQDFKKLTGEEVRKGEMSEGSGFFGIVFTRFFDSMDGEQQWNRKVDCRVDIHNAFKSDTVQEILKQYSKTGKVAIAIN